MATSTGSFTISGGSGISSVLSVTNDAFGLALASSFQSLTAQLASTPNSFYTFSSGSSFLAAENGLGYTGIAAPAGAVTVLGADGTNLVYNGPIASSDSGDTAVIVGGNGNDTISTGAGSATVAAGTGHNGIVIGENGLVDSAGTDTVIAGLGSTTVNVSGTGSFIASSEIPGSTLVVNDASGTNATIYAVNATTVTGASVGPTTIDGYGPVTVDAGAGGTQYSQFGGTLRLYGLSGETDNIAATGGGPDTLYGASGTVINLTGSTANNIFVGNDTNHGGSGSVDFNASGDTGGNAFWAGSGNTTLIGGTGTDTLVAGAGSATITGGSGASNYFDFFSSNGGSNTKVTINDFGAASGNSITLFGYGLSGVSAALASQVQESSSYSQGQGTLITLNDGSTIFLKNQTTFLTASSFHYTDPSSTT